MLTNSVLLVLLTFPNEDRTLDHPRKFVDLTLFMSLISSNSKNKLRSIFTIFQCTNNSRIKCYFTNSNPNMASILIPVEAQKGSYQRENFFHEPWVTVWALETNCHTQIEQIALRITLDFRNLPEALNEVSTTGKILRRLNSTVRLKQAHNVNSS